MTRKEQAVALAKQGFFVFPLKADCTPAFKGWPQDATNDPGAVARIWDDEYNIGIATGRPCGDKYVNVVDIDVKDGKQGDKSLRLLEALYDPLPATRETRTASGGRHLFVLTDAPLANSVQKIGRGIDVRGRGGYVVAPGSVKNGKPYATVIEAPIADCPAWLAEMAGAARERATAEFDPSFEWDTQEAIDRAAHYLQHEAPEAVEGDGGDKTTYDVMCHVVRDFGVSPDTALDLALEHYNERCTPPWDAEDLHRKILNAYEYGENALGKARAENEFDAVDVEQKPTAALPIRNIATFSWSSTQRYLVRGLLNFGMVAIVSGPSGAGKSPLALDLAAHIATGRVWQDRKVKAGYALYLSTEGWTGLEGRLEALRREHFAGADKVPLDFLAASLDLRAGHKDTKAIIATVQERAAFFGLPPALVIVDTLSHTMGGGDESNPEHVRAVLRNAKAIAAKTGAAVLLLHHPTKDAASDYRGSSILVNDTDLLLKVDHDKRSKISTVSTPRVKEYAEIDEMQFRVKIVELGADSDGDPVTSVVVNWLAAAEREFSATITEEQRNALAALDTVLAEKQSRQMPTIATYSEWVDAVAVVKAGSTTRKACESYLSRSLDALLHAGFVAKTSDGQYVRTAVR